MLSFNFTVKPVAAFLVAVVLFLLAQLLLSVLCEAYPNSKDLLKWLWVVSLCIHDLSGSLQQFFPLMLVVLSALAHSEYYSNF